jgi:4-amino-4-deoxychorismate lyase
MTQPLPITTLINGRPADTISVHDRGLNYGDGLFETMAVVNGTIRRFDLHLDRLALGCSRLGIECPPRELLMQECSSLSRSATRAVLKLIVTRGIGNRGYASPRDTRPTRIVSLHDWPKDPEHWHPTGVAVRWCTTTLSRQPLLAGIKHLNRLEYILGRSEWTDPEIAEGLLRDTDGNVICGTMTNIFLMRSGELTTPTLDHCGVAGTTRHTVLALAKELEIPTIEAPVTASDVETADEVFLTNAVIDIWPVNRIGNRALARGQIAHRLQKLLMRLR